MTWVQILVFFAGLCTTVAVTPQLLKTWKTKYVDDVSLRMFFVLTLGLLMWTIYGFLKYDLPIVLTNGISFGLNCVMIIFYFKSNDR